MGRRRISKKDLKNVKNNFKKEKRIQTKIEGYVPPPKTILDVKEEVRLKKEIETGLSKSERRGIAWEKRQNLKEDFSNALNVKTSYGFDCGDLVSFTYKKKKEYGLIYKINFSNSLKTQGSALESDTVSLLSSVGFVDVRTKVINEIIVKCKEEK